MLTWTPALAVGVAELDAQHQELFRRAEAFLEAMEHRSPQRTAELLAFLDEHARVHFSAEERWMAEHAYPDLEPHRREHAAFLTQLHAHAAEPAAPLEVARWLVRWLHEHVVVADTAAARHALVPPERGRSGSG